MANIYDMIDTWNNAAVTFTALKMNVTDTASAAGSMLLDLQVGGVSKATIDKAGVLTLSSGITASGAGFALKSTTGEVILWYGGAFGFSSAASVGQSSVLETAIYRDAANILAQRNGTAAQAFRLSNSHTDASNYERGGFDWRATVNTLRIRSEAAGTGTVRIIAIDGFSKAGAAVAADIPAGTWALVRDTVGATTKLIYNNAGTLMSVALA